MSRWSTRKPYENNRLGYWCDAKHLKAILSHIQRTLDLQPEKEPKETWYLPMLEEGDTFCLGGFKWTVTHVVGEHVFYKRVDFSGYNQHENGTRTDIMKRGGNCFERLVRGVIGLDPVPMESVEVAP